MIHEIDNLLKDIQTLDGREMKNKRNEYLRKTIEIKALSNSNFSPQILFTSTHTPQQKRFIAACLIRLLCHNEDAIWEEMDFRHKVFSLFDEQLSHDIYPILKIGEKTESHEKLSRLKELEQKMLDDFKSLSLDLTNLMITIESQQKIMRTLKRPINKLFLDNFVDSHLISDVRLKELFDSLKSYEETSGISRREVFNTVNNVFTAYIRDIEQCSSEIATLCLKDIFTKIHKLINDDFGKSDIIKPAKVKLIHPSRKYPFHKIGEQIELKFLLKNEGLGYAFNVQIEVIDTDGLVSDFNQIVSLEMKVESFSIILPVIVSYSEIKNTSILIQWSWQNYDETQCFEEYVFELEPQKPDIDWDEIKIARPYSLNEVQKEEELVGRKELTANIYANLISDTIESAIIYGQKRVGKTSIARVLVNKLLKKVDFVPIFIRVANLDKSSPSSFIRTLGDAIVKATTLGHDKLSGFAFSKPVFTESLSPSLFEYFKCIEQIAPTLKFIIIIDEFDEIPSNLYPYTSVGDAFFHNIRGLSQEASQIGFILVGGENMQKISEDTNKLNLFSSFQVDYFNKEKFFGDFKDLIRSPSQGILEFSDDSIDEIYKLTEGNPFFTKFICDKLFKRACDKKDSYISIDETKQVIIESIELLSLGHVNHFWSDGIWEDQPEKKDLIETHRKRFLVAYAEIKRCNGNGRVRRQEISQSKILSDSDVATDNMIENFIRRGILLEENGYFRLKPRLFDDWLVQRGSQLLTRTFSDANAIENLKSKEDKAFVEEREVFDLTENWDSYRFTKITAHRVRIWLNQFADNIERRLMFKLLQKITFYSDSIVRERVRLIHKFVKRNMVFSIKEDERRTREILLSCFGEPSKSGSYYTRLYCQENNIISSNVSTN